MMVNSMKGNSTGLVTSLGKTGESERVNGSWVNGSNGSNSLKKMIIQ
jgi:hypothetical protein